MAAPRPSTNVSALHVFEVLRLVNGSATPLGPTELGRITGLPLGTVHRALTTLEETRYIARDERSGQYRPGAMPQHLAQAVFRSFPLLAAVQPDLHRIAGKSGQTTSLCVRVGWYRMTIAVVHGAEDLYHRVQLGTVKPLYSGIASLAILAFLGEGDFTRCLDFHRQRVAADAVPDAAELQRRCAMIRAAGVVVEQPDAADAPAIAVPLRDPGGTAVAAILLNGHRREVDAAASHLLAARESIEVRLRADPARCRSPFSHLDDAQIEFQLPL